MANAGPSNASPSTASSTASADPLAELAGRIEEARRLTPAPEPYAPPADPMARLRAALRGEEPPSTSSTPSPNGASSTGASSSAPSARADDAPSSAPGSLDALVGREILDLLASRPLPGEDRVEAVERLVVALRNPTSDNVRSVLEVLLRTRT